MTSIHLPANPLRPNPVALLLFLIMEVAQVAERGGEVLFIYTRSRPGAINHFRVGMLSQQINADCGALASCIQR